ncbi:MAG: prepilin-type N-terminal cleavage/methylation domain-containing protein [Gammaproteobacteria bacterium]|nr:prepilin-type N-terminal cleavage/methylation domain-containing protein [Gammaproteobacteria bacterium]
MPMRSRCQGFTLIELVVLIVVLGLALTGVTLVINHVVQKSPEALVQTRAMDLAQSYLEEILQKRFDENTGQGGIPRCDSTDTNALACSNTLGPDSESRNQFDDVDDYNGVNDQPPVTATGTVVNNYDGYRVQVSVSYAGTELGYSDNRRAKRITVSVTTPLGNVIPVSAYRVNY